ncbi:MAG: tetratricopeptide repeat protein [Deltaproteobacteria bacterium]|nr:tetratricopeptide repeat protein [Deltaproteobacteria bacterium]
MIEVTCAACGALNRIAEGDVSPGTKFVTCTSCKSRVALPMKAPTGAVPKVPPIPSGAIPKIPPPIPSVGAKQTGSIDLADLPAPKRTSPLATLETPSKPAPRSALADADLPAPKTQAKPGGAPMDLDDIMPADLPAPKAKTPPRTPTGPVPRPPAPAADVGIADLPAPKAKSGPKPPPGNALDDDILDLPKPKGPSNEIVDLPTPKAASAGIVDLPTPKMPNEIVDLPTPKGITDLPAPKPGANNDLPAPKGFFDDLPQPAKGGGAKGGGAIDLPAPKGFFDDLPQPAKGGGAAANKPDLPAPKGFFDDLPQPAKGGGAKGGVFDDLPEPSKNVPAMDLDALELDSPSLSGGKPLELGDSAGPALGDRSQSGTFDLGGGGFKDLELAEPSKVAPKVSESPIKIKAKADGATPKTSIASPLPSTKGKDAGLELALEEEPHNQVKAKTTQALQPKKQRAEEAAAAAARKKKQTQRVLAGVLGLALVGSGGYYFYQRHAAAARRADELNEKLTVARQSLEAATPNHWTKAATAARAVVDLDAHNAAGYGIGAEALIAGALDEGKNGPARIGQGRMLISKAQEASVTGPELDRAQAVAAIAANQPDRAIGKLQQLIAANPKDGFLQLYMGWAQLAKGDATAAIKAFDAAVAQAPATKSAALYGHGQAKLLMADIEGAKADFAGILQADPKNIPAQVGLTATHPPQQASQMEAELMALLANEKDIKDADPRAVVQAWTLAADVARQGGRLDVARDRYSKALAINGTDAAALTGSAAVELRDGKLAAAQDQITKALAANAENVDAQLVAAEIAIKQGRLPDALATIKKLEAHQPPLPTLQQAHLMLVKGRLLEAQGQNEDAIDSYVQGAKLAGDLDLSPTMAAVELLSSLAKKAADAHDDKKAEEYRHRADDLLQALAERAQDDPQLALTLGVAYLQAGDPAKAENLLRRAVEMRPNDPDAKLQLGKAYAKEGKTDDAVAQLTEAQKVDPMRTDIGLELARTLEEANRKDDAKAAYDRLVHRDDAPLIARTYAGKFYARIGDIKDAKILADPILGIDPENPAGHYLRGEGLLADGKLDEARTELTRASSAERDVQYFDALGRAAEASFAATNDTKFQELAIQSYTQATEVDPTWFNPWAGLGRAHVQRREFTKSIDELAHAYKIKEDAGVAYNFGLAYATLGPKPTAIQWLETSTRLDPKNADAWYALGELYRDSNRPGDNLKVVGALDKATRLAVEEEAKGRPIDWLTEAFYTLGDQYQLLHDESGQKRAWQKYVDRHPKDQAHYTTAQQALATTLKSVP